MEGKWIESLLYLYFRPYIANLLPCLGRICKREEEGVQDTLMSDMRVSCTPSSLSTMQKICPALMMYLYFRPYIANLLPCLGRICKREEEGVQDTLMSTMQKICPALMMYLYFRPYIDNLLPCLGRICKREEEGVQDTLMSDMRVSCIPSSLSTMQKICPALMMYLYFRPYIVIYCPV